MENNCSKDRRRLAAETLKSLKKLLYRSCKLGFWLQELQDLQRGFFFFFFFFFLSNLCKCHVAIWLILHNFTYNLTQLAVILQVDN